MVLAALFLGVAFAPLAASSQSSADEDQIREAIVRYQIAKENLKAEVYFLSVEGKDPGDSLLKRLADLNPPVKRKSFCKKTKDAVSTIVEVKTEKIGVLFEQGAIRRVSETKADVPGGYLCGSLCSANGVYHLTARDGRWVVTGFDPGAQS
jgi:hypothetical protein